MERRSTDTAMETTKHRQYVYGEHTCHWQARVAMVVLGHHVEEAGADRLAYSAGPEMVSFRAQQTLLLLLLSS